MRTLEDVVVNTLLDQADRASRRHRKIKELMDQVEELRRDLAKGLECLDQKDKMLDEKQKFIESQAAQIEQRGIFITKCSAANDAWRKRDEELQEKAAQRELFLVILERRLQERETEIAELSAEAGEKTNCT